MAEVRRFRVRENDEWAHADLASIARVLQETTGLLFPPNRREPAEAGIRRAMKQLGMDAASLQLAIASPGDARDVLVTELTVGETFFFREPGQLDYLRSHVLPELRDSVGATRPLRVWSAGCATGEEPYSLAMVLRDAAWPGPVALHATDIVPARLAVAKRGRYTKWSMRGVPEDDVVRYFDRSGAYFIVREDVRRAVDFSVLNLAEESYPSSATGISDFDIVFCRNVLIYFDRPTVMAIATRLLASLKPNGWLFLGASDPAIADMVPCEVVLTGAGLAYRPVGNNASPGSYARVPWPVAESAPAPRFSPPVWAEQSPLVTDPRHQTKEPIAPREDGRRIPAQAPAARPMEIDAAGAASASYERGDYEAAASSALAAIERGIASERTWVLLVRSHANAGRLATAGEAVAAGLDRHQLSAELRYLEGMLLAQGAHRIESANAFRRALYLDPGFAVAHLALGEALAALGDATGARRAYSNAESILRTSPSDALVPGADGATAERLLHIARFHIQSLNDRASSTIGMR